MLDASEEQTQREIRMYGCTETTLRDQVEYYRTQGCKDVTMMVASILSDCQEIMSRGPYDGDALAEIQDEQRQMLNRAKWILFNCSPVINAIDH